MLKTIGLMTFIKGDHNHGVPGCANYDCERGGCMFSQAHKCKVLDGKRCGYFEKAVLLSAIPAGLGPIVNDAYVKAVNLKGFIFNLSKDVRRCACGEVLKPRERVCSKCRENRRKETYRKNRGKKRFLVSSMRNT